MKRSFAHLVILNRRQAAGKCCHVVSAPNARRLRFCKLPATEGQSLCRRHALADIAKLRAAVGRRKIPWPRA